MSRLLLVLGLAALFGAVALVLLSRPAQDVGEPLSAPSAGPTPSPTGDSPTTPADGTPATTPSPTSTAPEVVTRSGRLADREVPAVVPPVRLVVPALGIDAPIGPVGVDPDGQMTVPTDVREIGWYRHGPVPGVRGSAVLAGHVDSRTQGVGVFFELDRLQPGDMVEVTDADGATTAWVVTGRQLIDKAQLPLEEVFRRDGPARLVLITCGGSFDPAQRSYGSNVVVTAAPP